MVKTIAYYLPQFHEIPENNEWWGKGFTEWTNLRKAKSLYKGHDFLTPLNNYCYNLLDIDTVNWQTELMNEYNVYGMCYYHYWFKGKKILEKPAENLLKNTQIKQNFMFMWANHDWSKSWIGIDELLIKQEYGGEEDWINHINYLIPFFKDERYIKIDNRPMFQLYLSKDIINLEEMINVWNRECKKNGLGNVYIIDLIDNYKDLQNGNYYEKADAITLLEHSTALNFWRNNYPLDVFFKKIVKIFTKNNKIRNINYQDIVKNSIRVMNKLKNNKNIFFGVTVGWDNTPRYGERGYVVKNSTPELFEKYLKAAFKISEAKGTEYVFVSCWNEWCEGMCLEPSKQFEYGYLKAIQKQYI
jgi:hypothetical protein